MTENKNLIISTEDLNALYKYTMEDLTSLGYYLCAYRTMNYEIWETIKPVYQKYLQKNSSESMIDRHVICNLNLLFGSVDMMYPEIYEDDDIFHFLTNTYNGFLDHDEHDIKEKWKACIKNNTWHPKAWAKLRDEIVEYLKFSKDEPYLYKDYFAVLNLVAVVSRSMEFDITSERNFSRNYFLLSDHKFNASPSIAYMDLFNKCEEYIESKEENVKLRWSL